MATTANVDIMPKIIARHAAAVSRQVKRGVLAGARRNKVTLVRVTPKDRGQAQHGWHVYPGNGRNELATLMNSTPYIGILEKGARPHKVSWEGQYQIYLWIERHFRLAKSGEMVSGEALPNGARLTNRRSRAFKFARAREPLSKHGAMVKRAIQETHPEYSERLIPAALNMTGAIVWKLMKKGQAPKYFIRGALQAMTKEVREEVQRCLAEINVKGGQA